MKKIQTDITENAIASRINLSLDLVLPRYSEADASNNYQENDLEIKLVVNRIYPESSDEEEDDF